ncbi:acetyltransferase [Pseudotenacibaculum haliotis]|uniref:Acetyltransferase n=1 Tax=Pseudotenacibaculum haliotis TaxID=1862138 RepID=A0ABW5LUS7_9FLAO
MSQNKQEKLIIVGTGDYALMAHFYLKEAYDIVGFSEEAAYKKKEEILGIANYDFEELTQVFKSEEIKILVAVGPNKVNTVRQRLYEEVKQKGYECISYIHPDAYVWDHSKVGENSFIFPNVTVEPFAEVGNNCIMWSGAILAHHSTLEDHCFMAPGAAVSGRTVVKNNCFIGINSTVRDNVVVAEKTIVGGGAVIKKDTEKDGVYSATRTELYNSDSTNTKV